MGKIISVTSGKGGVGKTLTTINMAIAAQKGSARVLIVDGDLGMSNVDVMMGIEPKGTLKDVLDGVCSVSDIIVRTASGVDVISSGSGVSQLANMSPLVRSFLMHELSRLPDVYDYVFIDTGAGISEGVLALNSVSDLMVVVTTPEPHAITDAYAMIKVMGEEHDRHDCALIVNQTVSAAEGSKIAARVADVAAKFCGTNVHHLGSVVTDPTISRAILSRNVGAAGALSTLCGQGWASAWQSVLDITNSSQFVRRSEGLRSVWTAMTTPAQNRQNLDL